MDQSYYGAPGRPGKNRCRAPRGSDAGRHGFPVSGSDGGRIRAKHSGIDWHGHLTRPPVVAGIAVACTLMWGSSFPLIKIGYAMLGIRGDIVSIMYFAAFRFIIAAMIMLAGMKLSGRSILVREKADYLYLVIIALLQTTIQFTLFYIGLANTTGTKAAIINGSGSFFVVIFSHMFFAGDKISLRKLAGILLGFAGLVLVNLDSNMIDCSFSFTGEGFILLTSITGAIGTVVIKKVSARISPVQITAFQFLIGAAMLFAISAALEFPPPLAFTPGSLLLLIYLGVISSASFSLWYLLIRHNNLSRVAVYFFLVPIWGALSSTILIDTEFLSLVVSAALLLVSMGIFLTNMAQRPLKKKDSAITAESSSNLWKLTWLD